VARADAGKILGWNEILQRRVVIVEKLRRANPDRRGEQE
jgi:hypothetical protein